MGEGRNNEDPSGKTGKKTYSTLELCTQNANARAACRMRVDCGECAD
jgi:hypothetical protein